MTMQVALDESRMVLKSTPYADEERRIAVEACRRYGVKPTARLLAEMWPGRSPDRGTLTQWLRGKPGGTRDNREPVPPVVPDARAEQYWDNHEATRQQALVEQFAQRLPRILDSMDRLVAKDNGTEAKNMAIAAGIFYDKVVPVKTGGGVNIFGGAPNFHINTYAPAGQLPGVAVIEASSREV